MRALLVSLVFALPGPGLATPDDDDPALAEAVQHVLRADPRVDGDLLSVEVERGIVTLEGTLDNLLSRGQALELASTVKGVRAVIGRIEVEPHPVDDHDLGANVRAALRYDPAVDDDRINVEVTQGVVTLAGQVLSPHQEALAVDAARSVRGVRGVRSEIEVRAAEARPGKDIQGEITGRLRSSVWIDADFIGVSVHTGVVNLSGKVSSLAEKYRVLDAAWVPGVLEVKAEGLEVDPTLADARKRGARYQGQSDGELKRAILDAFALDPRLEGHALEVEVNDGVVTIKGQAPDLQAREAAAEDARNAAGVAAVHNHAHVRRVEKTHDDGVVSRAIGYAIYRDPFVHEERVTVQVLQGHAYLYGTVPTPFHKQRLTELAAAAEGVTGVSNRVQLTENAPQRPSGDTLREAVARRLDWQSDLEGADIEVDAAGDVVTLTGAVDIWQHKRLASELAVAAGARRVFNHLKVRFGPGWSQTGDLSLMR